MNLVLKAPGVKQVTRNEMLGYKVPDPTPTYTPVSNELIIETALEQLDKQGFSLVGEFYKQSTENKFVGGLILDGADTIPGHNFEFAFKNSYDKTMSIGLALGQNTFICSNSSVSAEFTLKRVHTGAADKIVVQYIQETIKEMHEHYFKMIQQFDSWKQIEVTKRLCAEVGGRLYLEERILSPNQLSVLREELKEESFYYGVENTLYNLYEACTHSLKSEPPLTFINTHAKLNQFFVNNFN